MEKRFTLVELLVVIGVIGVLAGLLMPVLSHARAEAASSSCRNNIRQVATMHLLYAEISRGVLCPAVDGKGDQWDSSADHKDSGILSRALPGAGAAESKVFSCPDADSSGLYFRSAYTAKFAGYGYNFLLSYANVNRRTPADFRKLKIFSIHRPSACVLLADAAYFSGANRISPTAFLYPPSSGSGGYADFRHLQSANAAYADGHVAKETEFFPAVSGEYRQRLGYLSKDDGKYDPFWKN